MTSEQLRMVLGGWLLEKEENSIDQLVRRKVSLYLVSKKRLAGRKEFAFHLSRNIKTNNLFYVKINYWNRKKPAFSYFFINL